MQQVEVFNLGELTERLLILQGRSIDEVWAEEKNALFRQLERAAASQKLRVRHPETMLPEVFSEWAPPSSGCLVCTIADVNAWLVSEGVPYNVTPRPDSTVAQPQAVPVEAPPVVPEPQATTPSPAPVVTVGASELPEQRRARWLAMLEVEEKRGKRGALQRVADREGVDRSNMRKGIEKARAVRTDQSRAGFFVSQLVQDGKRKG